MKNERIFNSNISSRSNHNHLHDLRNMDGGKMKKIFEWLREQINDGREFEHDERNECFNNGLDYAIRRVDEAEAKWEAEYNSCKGCVREDDENSFICSACSRLHGDEYEPIKISEVE